jgi:hypothetical protein
LSAKLRRTRLNRRLDPAAGDGLRNVAAITELCREYYNYPDLKERTVRDWIAKGRFRVKRYGKSITGSRSMILHDLGAHPDVISPGSSAPHQAAPLAAAGQTAAGMSTGAGSAIGDRRLTPTEDLIIEYSVVSPPAPPAPRAAAAGARNS